MQSRMIHLNLKADLKDWLDWAYTNKIDSRITSFLEFRPALFHAFDPNHKDNTYCCPRTWHFAHKLIKDKKTISPLLTKILAGTVGEGAAYEFKGFTDIYESLPKLKDIIKNPTTITLVEAPDVMFATSGLISTEVTEENIEPLLKYVERLPMEFQIITWISAIRRNKSIYNHSAIKRWISTHAKEVQF